MVIYKENAMSLVYTYIHTYIHTYIYICIYIIELIPRVTGALSLSLSLYIYIYIYIYIYSRYTNVLFVYNAIHTSGLVICI